MIWHQTAVTLLRAPLIAGGYGNSSRDWAHATSTAYLVKWTPQSTAEVVGDQPRTVTGVKVTGGPEFDITATDRVIGPDGNTYEVYGDVMKSFHPRTGALHHVGAVLRRVTVTV